MKKKKEMCKAAPWKQELLQQELRLVEEYIELTGDEENGINALKHLNSFYKALDCELRFGLSQDCPW